MLPTVLHIPRLRRRLLVRGQVQGVGFRPFLYRLASQHGVGGFVRNGPDGVVIELEGTGEQIEALIGQMRRELPRLAIIDAVEQCELACTGEREFRIEQSEQKQTRQGSVTVDTPVCPDCLSELMSTADRRRDYGLINCTNCGPRFSIIRRIPYDRPNTTMAGFAMCPACRGESENPADRRFHAQPIACHACGPRVWLTVRDEAGRFAAQAGDAIDGAVGMLRAGKILALKGLGGFHLACRAADEAAVQRLRKLKHRDAKPLALMVPSIEAARELVELSESAEREMRSAACPILLARRRAGCAGHLDLIAPGNHRLGVMLPYTPIHHLLFGRDSALGALVMTSANLTDEPIAKDNEEAERRLGHLCDGMLVHDRPIERCVDDSVVIDMGEAPVLPVRRARGYVPGAIRLTGAKDDSVGLCVGGELKNAVAVVRGSQVVLSQHIGDLKHPLAYEYFRKAVADMQALFEARPQWIAHDLHPLYLSTVFAKQLAGELGVPLVGVQHHHAHAAALMAEQGVEGPMLAVVCDGVGYGPDGTIWGGELLEADRARYRRIGGLGPMPLPGGDAAAKDTRRCGLALLHQAFGEEFGETSAAKRLVPDESERAMLVQMILGNVNCATSSAAGRVFDGVAALLGLCAFNEFEAAAGMAVEAAASRHEGECTGGALVSPDLGGFVRDLVTRFERGENVGRLAWEFHWAFAELWASLVLEARERTGIGVVGLSGGVFCNELLTRLLIGRLEACGMRVLRHRVVPANDGGLALGQAAVAMALVA